MLGNDGSTSSKSSLLQGLWNKAKETATELSAQADSYNSEQEKIKDQESKITLQNKYLTRSNNFNSYNSKDMLDKLLEKNCITPDHYKYYLEDTYRNAVDKILFSKDAILSYYRNVTEKLMEPDLAAMLKCTPNQFSKLYFNTKKMADILNIKMPDIYIFYLELYGANAEGLANPRIEIYSRALEDMTEDEMNFLVGRELAHIQCDHMLYEVLMEGLLDAAGYLNNIPGIGSILGIIGPSRVQQALKLVLYPWNRASEYTADCAGYLLTGGNFEASCSAILKLVIRSQKLAEQSSAKEFYKQVKIIDNLTGWVANYSKIDDQIPYGQFRIRELMRYASSARGRLAVNQIKKMGV